MLDTSKCRQQKCSQTSTTSAAADGVDAHTGGCFGYKPCPSFPCFLGKKDRKTTKKQDFFLYLPNPKNPWKRRENARKDKEFLAGEKNKEFQKKKSLEKKGKRSKRQGISRRGKKQGISQKKKNKARIGKSLVYVLAALRIRGLWKATNPQIQQTRSSLG